MIAHLTGKILSKQPNQLTLDVGGVGYDVTIPLSTFYELPDDSAPISLHIHTHVREETIALFGFLTRTEKQVFEKLISVSGIGPKLGIAILSGMSVNELVPSIQHGNIVRLTHIPGVGKKTAERLVLELRDKLSTLAPPSQAPPEEWPAHVHPVKDDAISALVNLGYPAALADKAVREVLHNEGNEQTFENLLKKSLQFLTR
ncbi:MAG: Holliday junction branch migration protein RuvA [Acidobacteriia bacterium]|nr:Holliday junction branch migration protein RuvA [Terriglobia bacterium]